MPINPILILILVVVLYLISSIKIVAEYERGVIFRLGKLLPRPKGPGLILVFGPIDRMVRVGCARWCSTCRRRTSSRTTTSRSK